MSNAPLVEMQGQERDDRHNLQGFQGFAGSRFRRSLARTTFSTYRRTHARIPQRRTAAHCPSIWRLLPSLHLHSPSITQPIITTTTPIKRLPPRHLVVVTSSLFSTLRKLSFNSRRPEPRTAYISTHRDQRHDPYPSRLTASGPRCPHALVTPLRQRHGVTCRPHRPHANARTVRLSIASLLASSVPLSLPPFLPTHTPAHAHTTHSGFPEPVARRW